MHNTDGPLRSTRKRTRQPIRRHKRAPGLIDPSIEITGCEGDGGEFPDQEQFRWGKCVERIQVSPLHHHIMHNFKRFHIGVQVQSAS